MCVMQFTVSLTRGKNKTWSSKHVKKSKEQNVIKVRKKLKGVRKICK